MRSISHSVIKNTEKVSISTLAFRINEQVVMKRLFSLNKQKNPTYIPFLSTKVSFFVQCIKEQFNCLRTIIKGQLISKGLFRVLIWTKNERKYCCTSTLACKKRSNKKIV